METLDDLQRDTSDTFDQFAGKGPSTYKDSVYTTELHMNSFSKSQIQRGLEVEKEILGQRSENPHLAEERN